MYYFLRKALTKSADSIERITYILYTFLVLIRYFFEISTELSVLFPV